MPNFHVHWLEGRTDSAGKIVVAESIAGVGRISFPDLAEVHVELRG